MLRAHKVLQVQQVHRVAVVDKAIKVFKVRRVQVVLLVHRVAVVDRVTKVCKVHKD